MQLLRAKCSWSLVIASAGILPSVAAVVSASIGLPGAPAYRARIVPEEFCGMYDPPYYMVVFRSCVHDSKSHFDSLRAASGLKLNVSEDFTEHPGTSMEDYMYQVAYWRTWGEAEIDPPPCVYSLKCNEKSLDLVRTDPLVAYLERLPNDEKRKTSPDGREYWDDECGSPKIPHEMPYALYHPGPDVPLASIPPASYNESLGTGTPNLFGNDSTVIWNVLNDELDTYRFFTRTKNVSQTAFRHHSKKLKETEYGFTGSLYGFEAKRLMFESEVVIFAEKGKLFDWNAALGRGRKYNDEL